jgi:hypothetical protein
MSAPDVIKAPMKSGNILPICRKNDYLILISPQQLLACTSVQEPSLLTIR